MVTAGRHRGARIFKRLPDGRLLINQFVGHRYPPFFGLAKVLDANLERVAIVSPRPPVNDGYGHNVQMWRIGASAPEVGTGMRWFRVTGDPGGTLCGQHAASLSREGNPLLLDNESLETPLERYPANRNAAKTAARSPCRCVAEERESSARFLAPYLHEAG